MAVRTDPVVSVDVDADAAPLQPTQRDDDASEGRASDAPSVAREVRLSGGRLAVMRETSGLDEEGVEALLVRWQVELDGVQSDAYGRILAVMGLASLDGVPFERPQTKTALDALMGPLKVRDLARLQHVYNRLNGLSAPTPEAPRTLAENELYLSDGRFVVVAEETALDEQRTNRALHQMGYTGMGIAHLSYMRARSLMSIEMIDGARMRPPQSKAELNKRLAMPARDVLQVINLYVALNGLGAGAEEGEETENGTAFRL